MSRLFNYLWNETPIGRSSRAFITLVGPGVLNGLYFQSWELGLMTFLLQMYLLLLAEVYGFNQTTNRR